MLNATDREYQVATLVAQGLTNREIADDLEISPRTVEAHVASLLRRNHVTSRTQLMCKMREPCSDGVADGGEERVKSLATLARLNQILQKLIDSADELAGLLEGLAGALEDSADV